MKGLMVVEGKPVVAAIAEVVLLPLFEPGTAESTGAEEVAIAKLHVRLRQMREEPLPLPISRIDLLAERAIIP
jgi:hypothetical protein